MTYVIAEPCIDIKDKSCIEECPVDCIYEGERMLYIQPDECVDCGACEPVCPVEAIYYEDDVPENFKDYSVCVSDQSTNKDVLNVCKEYSEQIDIKYIKNSSKKNSTQNINNSLFNSEGEIVKIMFMDDYFYTPDALNIIVREMETNNSILSLFDNI